MSTKKTNTKEKNSKGKVKKPSRIATFCRSEQGKFVFGIIIMAISAMLGVAFLSFFVTGKEDQAILEHLPWYKVLSPGNGIHNWMGTFGAFASEWCINRWLGLPVLGFIILFLKFGMILVQEGRVPSMLGEFVRCSFWIIWSSFFLSSMYYVLDEWFDLGLQTNFYSLGGYHGYALTQIIAANFHITGLFIILFLTGVLLSIFMIDGTIDFVRSIFGVGPKVQDQVKKIGEKIANHHNGDGEGEETPEDQNDEEGGDVNDTELEPESEETDKTSFYTELNTPSEDLESKELEQNETTDTVTEVELPLDTIIPGIDPTATLSTDPTFVVTTGKTETVDEPVASTVEDLPQGDYDPTAELSHYRFPGFELLKEYSNNSPIDMDEQTANKEKIRQTLSDYGVEVQSISATVGPTITLFEIVLVNGTKISRVKNLSDEIAMSIASKSGIRIIAPIPGKSAIGIEVPNNDPQTVSMRDCIASRAFQESRMELPVALGKTITNDVFVFDLAKAPHLLVAGATGQGKSVGLNAIVTSLLYKKHPSQLKIVLVDPKMVEFSIYKRIEKHYLAKLPDQENPIITDVTKTVDILKSLCAEMEDRYALVEDAGVRNIKEYNEKFIHRHLNPKKHISAPIGSREGTNHRFLPYIVAIIDEYGDLIMTAGKEVELPIARIAQKARAVGIHMIIATQRPSAKIVTGIIKANFPARMAFRVTSSVDSSIILDAPGAQSLIGRGDLLFSTGNVPTRVQCAFVDTPEVDRINRFIADQQGYSTALILPEPKIQVEGGEGDNSGEAVDLNHLDPLFEECAEMVVATGQGSTSMIQRKFQIGYNRAGRVMDQLEAAGIVGPYSGSKARAVLVNSDSELRQILEDLKNR